MLKPPTSLSAYSARTSFGVLLNQVARAKFARFLFVSDRGEDDVSLQFHAMARQQAKHGKRHRGEAFHVDCAASPDESVRLHGLKTAGASSRRG